MDSAPVFAVREELFIFLNILTNKENPMESTVAKIAYLEDNPLEYKLVMHWLEASTPYQVTHFETLAAFHDAVERGERWDLVLSDVCLRDGDAVQGLSSWHARSCPVVFMTSTDHLETAIRAMRKGFEDFLPKPVAREVLCERIHSLIGAKPRSARRRVVAIGAHPDDVEIGVGGLLLQHAWQEDEVTIVTLSRGAQGGETEERAKESMLAADLMRARLVMGDFEDTTISEGIETIRFLETIIRELQPDTVYMHTIHDAHQDHRAVHRASLVATRAVPNLYCYQAPSTTIDFCPKRFVDIERFLERKIQVLSVYQSQASIRAYMQPDFVRSTAQYWGRFAQYRMVEPLEIIRERA